MYLGRTKNFNYFNYKYANSPQRRVGLHHYGPLIPVCSQSGGYRKLFLAAEIAAQAQGARVSLACAAQNTQPVSLSWFSR
jgi:hypothetical protein